MSFVSCPPERILYNIYKTWINYLQNHSDLSGVKIVSSYPDQDKDFVYPCIIVQQVGSNSFDLARNNGFYEYRQDEDNADLLESLRGYRISSMMQFDIITDSKTSELKLSGTLAKVLSPNGLQISNSNILMRSAIPINDYETHNSSIPTDLFIYFDFGSNVSAKVMRSFDATMKQCNFTVNYWVEYITAESIDKIQDVLITQTIA